MRQNLSLPNPKEAADFKRAARVWAIRNESIAEPQPFSAFVREACRRMIAEEGLLVPRPQRKR